MFPNKFVWLIGVDVEFVLPCRSDPLGRHGDESEQKRLVLSRCTDSLSAYCEVLGGVDYRGQNTVKYVQDEKYSAKSADFLRFLLYLCHVIDDFK